MTPLYVTILIAMWKRLSPEGLSDLTELTECEKMFRQGLSPDPLDLFTKQTSSPGEHFTARRLETRGYLLNRRVGSGAS